MSIFAPSASSLYQQMHDSGLDADQVFRDAGVDPASVGDAQARIPAGAIDRIGARAAALSGDPFFALREADYFTPQQLGALGFAWLASRTLREAGERLRRFARIVHERFDFHYDADGDGFRLRFSFQDTSEDPQGRDDAAMAILLRMCRMIHGPKLVPERVRFEHAETTDTSHYYTVFQCPVEFSAEANELVLPAGAADTPLTGGNEQLARMNDHIAVRYLASRDRDDVVNRVRACILEGIADGRATEEQAAAALHVSTRQLNRKLVEQGTSFKQLLNETRRELAEQYIADPSLTLTEISFLLGFSEASSFSRAFKRWTGRSPSEARSRSTTT